MLKKNPLLKFIAGNTNSAEVFHSSGYARAQNSTNFGSTSNSSLVARQQIDANRKIVQNYNYSHIMQQTNLANPNPQTYTPHSSTQTQPTHPSPSASSYLHNPDSFTTTKRNPYTNNTSGIPANSNHFATSKLSSPRQPLSSRSAITQANRFNPTRPMAPPSSFTPPRP